MPYITREKRAVLDPAIDELFRTLGELDLDDDQNNTEGNINYAITRLLMMVYGDAESTRYAHINDAIGVLECIKMEYYQRVAAPYEIKKMMENGSVKRNMGEPEVVGTVEIDEEQAKALDEMTQLGQEMGDYEVKNESGC